MITWTPEMDAALRELRAKGIGVAECGERIGVSDKTVSRRIDALGLPKFRWPLNGRVTWTPEMDTTVREMRGNRASIDAIAESLEVSHWTVRNRLTALGLPVRLGRK